MMIKNFQFLLGLLAALFSNSAYAQSDASAALLLRPSKVESASPNLDSSRYVLKAPSSAVKPAPLPVTPPPAQTSPPPTAQAQSMTPSSAVSQLITTPPPIQKLSSPPVQPAPAADTNRSLTEQIRNILLGGNDEAINEYLGQLHGGDVRQNIVNISVAPNLMYVDSSSDYWYRDYHSSGPGLSIGAEVWFTPFTGFDVDYTTSLAAELDADPNSARAVLVDHRFTDVGFLFRNFSSVQRKSMSFTLGLKYSEYQMIIPKNETDRARLKSSGIGMSLEVKRPKDASTVWVLGADLLPKLKVKEGGTEAEIESGLSVTSYGVKFTVGQEFRLNRQNQIYWNLSHRFDKSVYQGIASPADPISGTNPVGVTVDLGMTMFGVGYSWGD